ncbi:MAG: type I-E CRISPR-associated protein Cas6/Cse3/CasE [Desulfobacterales bacterium]|nr:type I-E CRISPR-associated protein Cas6/Cse3/CasE [Desulfobacterales bacterium]
MSMIASVLHLDRKAVKALRITDPYSLHRVVYSLYDDVRDPEQKSASRASGILFADQGGDFSGRRILMLADRNPADCVDGQYGRVQSKAIPDGFLDHHRYRFKVIVNPTRRDSTSRKLVPIKGREAIAQWFVERARQSWGFSVSPEHLQVDKIDVLQFSDKRDNPVTICQAHVQGQLSKTDHEQFCNSFNQGIGRARAFGCGLLQIVPVMDNPFD